MKFGKYLAKRQLDLPEYADHFIDYKALKKVIKSLGEPGPSSRPSPNVLAMGVSSDSGSRGLSSNNDVQRRLQENKAAFFFQLERELEKVNNLYLIKERELQTRIDLLVRKKQQAYQAGELYSASSAAYISSHEGFLRFQRDLDRLGQFIELNQTGFSKVLKKWDKRSKSHTKELYLARAVEIQPVFHREQLSRLSDVASSSVLELEALIEGDELDKDHHTNLSNVLASIEAPPPHSPVISAARSAATADDLYHEFYRTATTPTLPEKQRRVKLEEWVERLKHTDKASESMTRTFYLMLAQKSAPEYALEALIKSGCVDLHAQDDMSGKNMLHRAAQTGRTRIVELGLAHGVDPSVKDLYGRTVLHYACMGSHLEIVRLLIGLKVALDDADQDNFTPLLYAVFNGVADCVQLLLDAGAIVDPQDPGKGYIPLNLACKYGNEDIVRMLLTRGASVVCDAEFVYPIHIAAKHGQHQLVPILKPYCDLDQLDKFNGWTALCYACSEGHPDTVRALIDCGADVAKLDEEGYSALYHACWEGHVACVYILTEHMARPGAGRDFPIDTSKSLLVQEAKDNHESEIDNKDNNDNDEMDLDAIPDLSLPPPIIPVQRYGHNFVDKKVIVQLFFDRPEPIEFFDTHTPALPAARLKISARNTRDLVPRNLTLPMADTDRALLFEVDDLAAFSLDFEISPIFGSQVVGKTTALPSLFAGEGAGRGRTSDINMMRQQRQLALYDKRLRAVGQMSISYQIVKPFAGKALEIAKYDTYWKSTSQVERPQQASVQSLSFVTASSLNGAYCGISVCLTKDMIPVVYKSWEIVTNPACDIKTAIGNINWAKLKLLARQSQPPTEQVLAQLRNVTTPDQLAEVLENGSVVLRLADLLKALPISLKVDVAILYPTLADSQQSECAFVELNTYVDSILAVLFDHVREVRKRQAQAPSRSPSQSRSLIFTSCNPDVCAMLNWKQPNYPVFFHMNGLRINRSSFAFQSAHGFDGREFDRRNVSIKEAASFAANNNLLGVVVSSRLVAIVPSLIDTVRALGLVLVTHVEDETQTQLGLNIDGVKTATALTFKGSIDM